MKLFTCIFLQERTKIDAYMTHNLDSPLTWPEESLTKDVMCNEDLIPYHVCINPFYNETAHYADIVSALDDLHGALGFGCPREL